jgi:vancomycin permeability regulator SanA
MKVNPPACSPVAADAVIVIFGAAVRPDGQASETLRRRVEAAARFGRRFATPLFIPTGAKGRYGDTEAAVMGRLLIEAGFSADAIQLETTGRDTLSSVRAVARMVHGKSTVYACTSGYHLPRCLVLLRLAGVSAQACPPPPLPENASLWSRWYWRLREAPALPYDLVLMLCLRAVDGA